VISRPIHQLIEAGDEFMHMLGAFFMDPWSDRISRINFSESTVFRPIFWILWSESKIAHEDTIPLPVWHFSRSSPMARSVDP
jgi:hypothetical protein